MWAKSEGVWAKKWGGLGKECILLAKGKFCGQRKMHHLTSSSLTLPTRLQHSLFCIHFACNLYIFCIFFVYFLLAGLQTKPVWCGDWWPYTALQVFSVFAIKSSSKVFSNHDTVLFPFLDHFHSPE